MQYFSFVTEPVQEFSPESLMKKLENVGDANISPDDGKLPIVK